MLTNDCGCTSFVQSETQTRVLQGVILSMYEINIITHIFFPWTKQIHLVGATVECSVTNCIQASLEGFLGFLFLGTRPHQLLLNFLSCLNKCCCCCCCCCCFRRHTYKPLSLRVTKQTLFICKCCLAKLEAQMPRATLLEHCTSSVSNR